MKNLVSVTSESILTDGRMAGIMGFWILDLGFAIRIGEEQPELRQEHGGRKMFGTCASLFGVGLGVGQWSFGRRVGLILSIPSRSRRFDVEELLEFCVEEIMFFFVQLAVGVELFDFASGGFVTNMVVFLEGQRLPSES